jgi:hypothetical protein
MFVLVLTTIVVVTSQLTATISEIIGGPNMDRQDYEPDKEPIGLSKNNLVGLTGEFYTYGTILLFDTILILEFLCDVRLLPPMQAQALCYQREMRCVR